MIGNSECGGGELPVRFCGVWGACRAQLLMGTTRGLYHKYCIQFRIHKASRYFHLVRCDVHPSCIAASVLKIGDPIPLKSRFIVTFSGNIIHQYRKFWGGIVFCRYYKRYHRFGQNLHMLAISKVLELQRKLRNILQVFIITNSFRRAIRFLK